MAELGEMDMEKIGRMAGRLMIRRDMIAKHTALRPSAAMLPAGEFVLRGDPEDARIVGLPVVWGDRVALIYDA